MSINKTISELQSEFEKHANPENAVEMKRYMRDKFEFYGLKSPERSALVRQFWKNHEKPTIDELKAFVLALWESKYRDFHYQALELMASNVKKLPKEWIHTFEYFVITNSWWDSVDLLSTRIIGEHLKRFPELRDEFPEKWIMSDNFWLNRVAIIFQLKYKTDTDTKMLFDFILIHADSKEFFIQKAAGWALREYSKTDSDAVKNFIEKYRERLPNLTIREGLKWMKNKGIL